MMGAAAEEGVSGHGRGRGALQTPCQRPADPASFGRRLPADAAARTTLHMHAAQWAAYNNPSNPSRHVPALAQVSLAGHRQATSTAKQKEDSERVSRNSDKGLPSAVASITTQLAVSHSCTIESLRAPPCGLRHVHGHWQRCCPCRHLPRPKERVISRTREIVFSRTAYNRAAALVSRTRRYRRVAGPASSVSPTVSASPVRTRENHTSTPSIAPHAPIGHGTRPTAPGYVLAPTTGSTPARV